MVVITIIQNIAISIYIIFLWQGIGIMLIDMIK